MRAAAFDWTDDAVRRALGLEDVVEPREMGFGGVCTDTRTLQPGDLFVALKGPRFDGHSFLNDARGKGARAAVISSDHPGVEGLPSYPVEDTLVALGQLARFRRRALSGRVVAITGSSGKTTVKELLREVLSVRHRVHATRKNLNNRVGVPLTLLDAGEDAEFVVVELGTSERGEIGRLARIVEADVAAVVTVSESHLEGLGDLDGVMEEKLDLLAHLRPGAIALVGDRPAALPRRATELHEGVRVAGFSERAEPELRGWPEGPDAQGRVPFRFQERRVRPGLPGRHGAFNTLFCLSVARVLGISLDDAIPAVEAARPAPLRGELRRVGSMTLLLDCYNANPQSVLAAVDLLSTLPARGSRVAVLGSMLELGGESEALHREVLEQALQSPVDLIVAVGLFREVARPRREHPPEEMEFPEEAHGPVLLLASDVEEAWDRLVPHLRGRETVLLKASRGLAMERLVPRFEERFRPAAAAGGPNDGVDPPAGAEGRGLEGERG